MIDDDRELFERGDSPRTVGRQEIVDSWKRSRLSGVSADSVTPVISAAPRDSKFARVAVPVLAAMAETLEDTRTSLLLSAPDGTMLWRWSEDTALSALLDRGSAVVGTRWSEDVVGTNGLGTALETLRPVQVIGSEHFSEPLHPFACLGAPVRHPITRRAAGTLSITSLVEHMNPLMTALLRKLVLEVEQQLYGDSTLQERELLHHFLAERRRGRGAVIAVNDDVVIADKAGAQLPIDARSVWAQIEHARGGAPLHLDLPEEAGEVHWRAIEHAGSVAGLLLVTEPDGAAPRRPAPRRGDRVGLGAVASGPGWDALPDRLRTAAAGSDRVLVIGEPGVGKRTLLHQSFGSGERLPEIDGIAAIETGTESWLSAARRALTAAHAPEGHPVLLSHLEALTPVACRALGRILDDLPRLDEPRLLATWNPPAGEAEPALQALVDRIAPDPFEVPALRRRTGDVQARLVDQERTFPGLTPGALEQIQRHPWPGNHRQLEEFRRWMARQSRPVLDVDDLPVRWTREAVRARLTAIQAAEADTIDEALRASGGNKRAAAEQLGISRSFLYRKMREYRLG